MTIDHTKVPSTQSNFTVLVSLTDPALKTVANGGHVGNANGYDIGFYADSGGTTKLKWEVEKYDGVTGNLIAWVKIPSVSSSSDTVFYLMYGDSTINTDQSDPPNTWDSNFKSVWHLGNGSTLSLNDSTSNGSSLANVGATGATTGKISGGAGPFNGTSQCLKTVNSINLGTNKVTQSAWVNITGYTNSNFAALAQFASTNWWFDNNSFSSTPNEAGTWGVWAAGSGGSHNGGKFTRPSAGVHHVVFTYDTTQGAALNVKAYVDGVAQTITQTFSDNTASANFGNYIVHLMAQSDETVFWPATYLDEVRLSSSTRSATWITTEYNNQSSPGTFITIGSESCATATPSPTPTPTATPTPTPTPSPTPQFAADNFNRADGGLGLNWAKPLPASEQTLTIVNNQVTPDTDNAHCYAYWVGNTFNQDQYSQAQISNVGPWNGVITRVQAAIDRFYMAFVFAPNDYRLYLRKDGLYYSLATGSTETWLAGDIIRLETSGLNPVQLTLLRNGNPVLTYTDAAENLVGGSPGIGIYSRTGDHLAIDNWEGGNLGPLGPLMLDTRVRAPMVPGNLVAKAVGISKVKLTWAAATDKGRVRRYEVERRDPGSNRFVHAGRTAETSYNDTGLAAGSSYSYRVLVRDATGSLKEYSGVATVTTGSPTIDPQGSR